LLLVIYAQGRSKKNNIYIYIIIRYNIKIYGPDSGFLKFGSIFRKFGSIWTFLKKTRVQNGCHASWFGAMFAKSQVLPNGESFQGGFLPCFLWLFFFHELPHQGGSGCSETCGCLF
jgi:hypothetical protein